MTKTLFGLVLLAALAGPALAADPLPPETFGVKAAIDPGPNVFVYQEDLVGPGSIAVFGADSLVLKGLMTTGSQGQMFVSPDGKSAYVMSTFFKRYTYGDAEFVLQIFDVPTLTPVAEVLLPAKGVMALSYAPLLQRSADGRFVYVQNATPASSITVVDLDARAVTQEIPTPGCWGIYPAASGPGFSTLCGDGSVMAYTPSADGRTATDQTTPGVFDPDADPLFITASRDAAGLVFVSFKGSIVRVADGGKPIESFSFVEGVEGGWVPGGYQLIATSPDGRLVFVGMHSGGYDGSHKNPAEEIWAIDLAKKAVVGRAAVPPIASFTLGAGPTLYGLTVEGKLVRFGVDTSAGLALTASGELGLHGFPFVVQVSP